MARGRSGCARAFVGAALASMVLTAGVLAATPGAGQDGKAPPQPASGGPIVGAGESGVAPAATATDRDQMVIVGSSTVYPFLRAAIERLQRSYVLPAPIIDAVGTTAGIKLFCAGVGAEFPDVAAASRGMQKSEFDTCIEHHVLDIIEVKIGQTAFALVVKKGSPVFNMTARMIYLALAAEIPEDGEFAPNPFTTWRQIDKDAPPLPINVIIPTAGSGQRTFFDDNFMQGGCRHVKEIDAIFAAIDRVPKCVTLRKDGHITQINESTDPASYGELLLRDLEKAPLGTIGLAAFPLYLDNSDKLDLLPIGGVLPSHDTIASFDYPMTSDLRLYFKRAHMRNNEGRGVVRGLRELMAELVSDDATGEGGYFEALGAVSYDDETKAEIQKTVRTLRRFKR
jgi:phosphate transport system substrate-binding protein